MSFRSASETLPPPIAIGGVGGSGTRLIAEVVRSLGVHMGDDLNSASDTLWFTLLFKRIEILESSEAEFDLLTQTFASGLQREPLRAQVARSIVNACASRDRPRHTAEWLRLRAKSLITAAESSPHGNRWGWKEPNTHVVIDRLWERLPTLRYIHVFRHGLDMAHSRNQNQLNLWGAHVLGTAGASTPQRSLAYWCCVQRRMQALHSSNPERMYLLDYDAFCARPEQQAAPLLEFLGLPDQQILGLARMVVSPRARDPWQPLESFARRDVEYVRSLGYDISRSGTFE